ncbi:putative oxidoreductase (short-chain dehydrogenase family) [Natrialba magadii ATCC 43099]|uniref:Oxidoreductase (Short-chain dehydrogenase family) n=1 Tax=Natrialba magadii (strain ATCC 43099 / DSM 3394 / CCM 3739 / CIP 104546 / IAM 13178 / JCM 8861 / NBRC 102185 / NCIMB 2190 / MS3) TaxID=547559 RepID=D3T064_NATMM|nr:NAD(P)-dependent oxidoreductase [Natrialba magadii]ADD04422.1 putative oxidoreductase (short-chain dehydrogenase family) [Natrialba magadii ATCC 43099]ELY25818.1 short-chain dehydrogenase/reductase SDR [Natrialba magadii ATCC 43099]
MALQKPDLSGQTAFITGTTRGIGKEIALALAEQGCNIVSTGKTSEKDADESEDGSGPDLEGSIEQTAREAREHGVEALPIQLDVRSEEAVNAAAERAIDEFGEVNIVINNASAIQLLTVEDLPPNRFDLMTDVNIRGTYLVSRAFAGHLREVENAWLLTNAPPVKIDRAPGEAPYAWSKLGMSFLTLSMASELGDGNVGCNTFWPVTAIDTRATRYFGLGTEDDWRTPEIVSDTVLEILSRDPASFTGNAVYDEELLQEAGVEDFSRYNLTEGDPAPGSAQLFDPEYSRSDE